MFDFVQKDTNRDCTQCLEKIRNLEKKYNIVFPPILKKYYEKHDGQKIRLCMLNVRGYECEISKMVPIISDKLSFEELTDGDRSDGILPTSFFPLARDRGGNYYYWDAVSGKVFYVPIDDYGHPFKVADSVQELFEIMAPIVE